MVDAALFDKLEELARTLRRDGRPFGGIQLVVTGDILSVTARSRPRSNSRFAFEAEKMERVYPSHHKTNKRLPTERPRCLIPPGDC
jgi:ATP-dependent DNA helicase PIF1